MATELTPIFLLTTIWGIGIAMCSVIICLIYFVRGIQNSPTGQRKKAQYLLLGVGVPALVGPISQRVFPGMQIEIPELTTLSLAIGNILIAFGIQRYGLFTLTPAIVVEDIVATMSNFLILVDQEGNIIQANPAAFELLGYSNSELMSMPVQNIMSKESWERIALPLVHTDQPPPQSNIRNRETQLVSKKGYHIPVILSISVEQAKDSNRWGTVWVGIDLTEYKRTNEALRHSEERYRQLVENASDIIYRTDRVGFLTFVNSVSVTITGYSEEELLSKRYIGLVRSDARDSMQRFYLTQFSSRTKTTYYECPIIAKNGREIWLGQNVELVISDGKVHGFQAVARDITELVRTQDELRKARDELEIRVQERTAALAAANNAMQQEIAERRQIEAQLKTSLADKEVLLKEIHHRVKNNLQIISSLLSLQSNRIVDPRDIMAFKESQLRVTSMALIHEKLYQSEDLASLNFTQYIEILANELYRSFGVSSQNVKLEVDVTNIPMELNFAIPCGLIINELLSNSLKYAFPNNRSGNIRIHFTTHTPENTDKINSQTQSPIPLTLLISDDGVGLPNGFDIDETETLGLKLVQTLVRQLGGSMNIETHDGTAFYILFSV